MNRVVYATQDSFGTRRDLLALVAKNVTRTRLMNLSAPLEAYTIPRCVFVIRVFLGMVLQMDLGVFLAQPECFWIKKIVFLVRLVVIHKKARVQSMSAYAILVILDKTAVRVKDAHQAHINRL